MKKKAPEKKKATKKKKWQACAVVVGGKYLGEVEAETEEEAKEKAWDMADVSLCHQCSSECENAVIEDITVEAVEDLDG